MICLFQITYIDFRHCQCFRRNPSFLASQANPLSCSAFSQAFVFLFLAFKHIFEKSFVASFHLIFQVSSRNWQGQLSFSNVFQFTALSPPGCRT